MSGSSFVAKYYADFVLWWLLELARVLVRLDHLASFIKNYGHNVRCGVANARPTGNNSLSVKLLVCRDQAI